jgi:hypothetical protein
MDCYSTCTISGSTRHVSLCMSLNDVRRTFSLAVMVRMLAIPNVPTLVLFQDVRRLPPTWHTLYVDRLHYVF